MNKLINRDYIHKISKVNIKDTHEKNDCCRFLTIYNLEKESDYNFLRQGNSVDSEPGCICSNNLGIELVGIYDNEYQAEKIWSAARGKITYKQPKTLLLTFKNLQNEIGKKLQKLNNENYNKFTGKIILLCNLHSPLLQDREVKNWIELYTPFRKNGYFARYFYEIWVSWKSEVDGSWKVAKLE